MPLSAAIIGNRSPAAYKRRCKSLGLALMTVKDVPVWKCKRRDPALPQGYSLPWSGCDQVHPTDAAWANILFGQVGPGMEACH